MSETLQERAASALARYVDGEADDLVRLAQDLAITPPVGTCATCQHHTDSDWTCVRGIMRPGRYRDGIPKATFGCTFHSPLPPAAPGGEG